MANPLPLMHPLSNSHWLVSRRKPPRPITALTAFDFPTARILDEAGIDMILVGDSLGMVALGLPDTTGVTLHDMLHHTRAVRRGAPASPVVADLPANTYNSPADAVDNARRLVDAGADAVKLEGCLPDRIQALTAQGIPLVAHLGMLPQHVRTEGGYKIKGKSPGDRDRLLDEARQVARAGASAVVLELVTPATAAEITSSIPIPTIGIGSGTRCDGQILVTHDLVGLFPWFRPKFVRPTADLHTAFRDGVLAFISRTHNESGSNV